MNRLAALLAGIVFGAGLVVSGMSNPDKVLAFLTLNESWDPSLIFVMGSAVAVSTVGFFLARRSSRPLFDSTYHTPQATALDVRLLLGAGIFGVGWGLSGYCPGPAIVGGFLFDARAIAFLAAFVAGVLIFDLSEKLWAGKALSSTSVADG